MQAGGQPDSSGVDSHTERWKLTGRDSFQVQVNRIKQKLQQGEGELQYGKGSISWSLLLGDHRPQVGLL